MLSIMDLAVSIKQAEERHGDPDRETNTDLLREHAVAYYDLLINEVLPTLENRE